MNFTIERAAFLTAAKRAAQLAPSASPLEVLKCALLEIDTGMRSLHMTATNMEVTLRQDVPLLAYEGGDTTFAIDAKLLSAMLANLPGNTVECCKGDKDTLALSSDQAYYQVSVTNGKGFPRMNITAPESLPIFIEFYANLSCNRSSFHIFYMYFINNSSVSLRSFSDISAVSPASASPAPCFLHISKIRYFVNSPLTAPSSSLPRDAARQLPARPQLRRYRQQNPPQRPKKPPYCIRANRKKPPHRGCDAVAFS